MISLNPPSAWWISTISSVLRDADRWPTGDPELFRDLLGRYIERDASDEHDDSGRGTRLEAVRFAYGRTGPETRRRLARVFTTPSAPEVLVAGSVMGEGIDLHTECAVVIHHDLDWNPGVIEQRPGRIERIRSLAERRGQGITVYVPFLAGTADAVVQDTCRGTH